MIFLPAISQLQRPQKSCKGVRLTLPVAPEDTCRCGLTMPFPNADMVAAPNATSPKQSYAAGWNNVFVSGGAGFLGSHLLRWLLKEERVQRVVIFDNFSSGQLSYIHEISNDPRLEIAKADLKELGAVKSAMAGCDTVFHLAANPDIARAVTKPDIDFWEGTYLTQNVLEAMRVNKVGKIFRSEERRVGKECRSRSSPYH